MRWLLAALMGLLAAGGVSLARPARADSPVELVPVVDCVSLGTDQSGAFVAPQWGYISLNASIVTVPIGPNNFFESPPPNQGQPTVFQPGTFNNVFSTKFYTALTTTETWALDGQAATASVASPQCGESNPPSNSTPPSVIGTAQVGATLTADNGEWLANCPVSFTDTWQSSLNSGPWTQVGTGATYSPSTTDLGALLRVEVVASDCHGTSSALDSASVGPVTAAPPAIGAALLPLVDCVTFNGSANTLTVQWAYYSAYAATQTVAAGTNNAVSPTPTSGTPITSFDAGLHHNAWSATLSLAQAQQLTWTLNGTSASASVASPECGEASAPSDQTPPTAIGTPVIGQTLTAADGEWLANCPVSFTNTWQRSLNGGAWSNVGTGNSYTLATADTGAMLRVEVLASDCHGQAAALDSAAVGPVTTAAQPPVNTSPPTTKRVAGTDPSRPDATLKANGGTWTGSPTLSYQWQRCTEVACTNITGATHTTYTPTDAERHDVLLLLRVVVTATNSAGSTTAVSAEVVSVNGADVSAGSGGSSDH